MSNSPFLFTIRPYSVADADDVYAAVRESLADLGLWMPWAHKGYQRHESETWLAARQPEWDAGVAYEFAIIDQLDGSYVGGCGVNQIRPVIQTGNIGYWVRSSRTRQGAASQAARWVAEFAFAELGLTRVEIVAAVGNMASQRAAEKAGAMREGVLRNRLLLGDEPVDAVLYSLVPDDLGI